MPDITKCTNDDCTIKETCYRHTAEASTWQSQFSQNQDGSCDMFLPDERTQAPVNGHTKKRRTYFKRGRVRMQKAWSNYEE